MSCWRFYGALNLFCAAIYSYLGFAIAPSRSLVFNLALAAIIALLATSGVGLLSSARWGRFLALVASVALLIFTAGVMILLVAAAAYLQGIYGSIGKGLSLVTIMFAALVFELFGLLPFFELRALLRGDMRRHCEPHL